MKINTMTDIGLPEKDCYIIAEIGQGHDGSLGTAHCLIDVIADAGADAVKFQTHIANAESTYDEPWRVKFSHQDKTRYDYWKRMEFSFEGWSELAEHARRLKLDFLSSPFSVEAVELLEKLEVKQWKVASGEIYNPLLLEALWQTHKPLLFSSGMSVLADLEKVVKKTMQKNIPFGIFQSTTAYPTPPELWGLPVLKELKNRFHCPIGLSDHSGGIYAGLGAIALGAEMLEVHVTFNKRMFGPDTSSSITELELAQLVKGSQHILTSINNAKSKDQLLLNPRDLRKTFGRSLALNKPLTAGSVIKKENLTLKKPAGGIPYEDLQKIVGKRLKVEKNEKSLLQWQDFE